MKPVEPSEFDIHIHAASEKTIAAFQGAVVEYYPDGLWTGTLPKWPSAEAVRERAKSDVFVIFDQIRTLDNGELEMEFA